MLLRQEVYGPPIDTWSAGCLLAEAVTGEPLFPSDSEIDHLFRVFQFSGTPNDSSWPEALALPVFSARFPMYSPVDLRLAARAALGCDTAVCTLRASLSCRKEMMETVLNLGVMLGTEGTDLLCALLRLHLISTSFGTLESSSKTRLKFTLFVFQDRATHMKSRSREEFFVLRKQRDGRMSPHLIAYGDSSSLTKRNSGWAWVDQKLSKESQGHLSSDTTISSGFSIGCKFLRTAQEQGLILVDV